MKRNNIIINADDLGISNEVNQLIEVAIKANRISSSSILVNGKSYSDAIRIAKSYRNISFGVHLNIAEFKPLTVNSVFEKYGLLSESGNFLKCKIFEFSDIPDDLVEAIYYEWKAQIEKLISDGIFPSHLDSHQHTHGIDRLQEILVRLSDVYGIKRIRRKPYKSLYEMFLARNYQDPTDTSSTSRESKTRPSFLYRRLMQIPRYYKYVRWITIIHKNNIAMTNHFYGYMEYYYCFKGLYKNRSTSIELMCHPGHKAYKSETELLLRGNLLPGRDFKLINYFDI